MIESVLLKGDKSKKLDSGKSGLSAIDAENLFINHNLLASHNTLQARSSVEDVFCPHRLRMCAGADSLNFTHRGTSLSDLSFNYISYGADVEVTVNDINRAHYIIVMPLSGEAYVTNRNQTSELNCESLVVLDPSAPFKVEMSPEHSHLAIGIPRQQFNAYLTKHALDFDNMPIQFQAKPYLMKDIGRSLFDFIGYVCGEIDQPATLLTQNLVANSLQKSFLTLLNTTLCQYDNIGMAENNPMVEPSYVKKAETFMEANLTEEITADDIVQAAGVPARTLYHAYSKYHGMSPMSWLKLRRLREARMDLLHESKSGILITELAHRYQQPHVGRFSKAYFDQFGEYPSDTLKSLNRAV